MFKSICFRHILLFSVVISYYLKVDIRLRVQLIQARRQEFSHSESALATSREKSSGCVRAAAGLTPVASARLNDSFEKTTFSSRQNLQFVIEWYSYQTYAI